MMGDLLGQMLGPTFNASNPMPPPPPNGTPPPPTKDMQLGSMAPGMIKRGNVNLWNRPRYRHPDGSVSTVHSGSFTLDDGTAVLLPMVGLDVQGNPVMWNAHEALQNYRRTGQNLGTFKTNQDADAYSKSLHEGQARLYNTEDNPRDTQRQAKSKSVTT